MFGGTQNLSITIRLIIGRGWGQGPTHAQSYQSMFAKIPGLKVVMPSTPYNAKGLLLSSIKDPNPVIFLNIDGFMIYQKMFLLKNTVFLLEKVKS